MQLGYDEPLTRLIAYLEKEANKWCKMRHCSACFGEATFDLEEIENCRELPELYKLYWEAKTENIASLYPLIINKAETAGAGDLCQSGGEREK